MIQTPPGCGTCSFSLGFNFFFKYWKLDQILDETLDFYFRFIAKMVWTLDTIVSTAIAMDVLTGSDV